MMNRRSNERIEMKLPCVLELPGQRRRLVTGVTANMHRDGVLICCDARDLEGSMPVLGAKIQAQVQLPPNPAFSPKCIVCETTLVRIDAPGGTQTHLAMKILSAAFRDFPADPMNLTVNYRQTTHLPV